MEITSITSSATRKINHALYGGGNYESSDIFVSLTADIEPNEDVLAKQKELHTLCEEMVQRAIEEKIVSFQGGLTPEDFYTYIRDMVSNRPIEAEPYLKANKSQQAILQAIKRGKKMAIRDIKSNKNDNGKSDTK